MKIETPFIPLPVELDQAVEILRSVSSEIVVRDGGHERLHKVTCRQFACGFYERSGVVVAAWYDDPMGREDELAIQEKISAYLARYGDLRDWEVGLNNGWVQFITNAKAGVGLAYGLDKDVFRFNDLGARDRD